MQVIQSSITNKKLWLKYGYQSIKLNDNVNKMVQTSFYLTKLVSIQNNKTDQMIIYTKKTLYPNNITNRYYFTFNNKSSIISTTFTKYQPSKWWIGCALLLGCLRVVNEEDEEEEEEEKEKEEKYDNQTNMELELYSKFSLQKYIEAKNILCKVKNLILIMQLL